MRKKHYTPLFIKKILIRPFVSILLWLMVGILAGIYIYWNWSHVKLGASYIFTYTQDFDRDSADPIKIQEDNTFLNRNLSTLFLVGTFTIAFLGLHSAQTTLAHNKALTETQILLKLIHEWDSKKMQAARASLSLKYLMKVKIGDNNFNDFLKSIKKSLEKSEHNKKYEKHIRSILNISSKQDAQSRLTNLTPEEESVINFFEKIGFLIEEGDLNEDDVWEAFITKIEPYYYKIGHPFINKKRERYSYRYYHYYKSLIDALCIEKFYKTKRDKYGENDKKNKRSEELNKYANFYSFKSPSMKENGEEKILEKCMFLAFSEIRYLTGENIRENYNK